VNAFPILALEDLFSSADEVNRNSTVFDITNDLENFYALKFGVRNEPESVILIFNNTKKKSMGKSIPETNATEPLQSEEQQKDPLKLPINLLSSQTYSSIQCQQINLSLSVAAL
jgi:hypothetical protein